MQPIENPFTDARPAARRGGRAAAADPPRRLPLRADAREERLRPAPRRPGQRRRRHPHPRADRRRADPAARHRLRQTTSGMTGPRRQRHRLRPETVLPRFLNALPTRFEVGERAGRLQRRPDRHRPGHGPGPRDRADPAASSRSERGRAARRAATASRPGRRARRPPGPSTIDLHTHTTPLGRRPRAGGAGRRGRRGRHPAPRHHRPRHARRLPRAAGAADACPPASSSIPGVEINAVAERIGL